MAMALFEEGQREAAKRDLILVDTKYEFGKTPEGDIVVVDEVHTPDSSRCGCCLAVVILCCPCCLHAFSLTLSEDGMHIICCSFSIATRA